MNSPSPRTRIRRVRHEVKRRELTVAHVQQISPHVVSVTFAGESLVDFISLSFDDHVKFILGTDDGEPIMRDYTPRSYDRERRELTIEFALHGDGPAARWARDAHPGQRVLLGGPRGSMIIPMDFDWHLLAGDETAMPAIARRLEELPAGSKAFAIIQITELADRRSLTSHADVEVQWATNKEQMISMVRALVLPPGEGFAWCAGEAGEVRALRQVFVEEKAQHGHAIRAAAYWKRGATAHHENLED
jgi:NADPH-dependent ferric siderophore reductase